MKKYYCLLVVLLGMHRGFAQQRADAYPFPVRPGTAEWKKLPTGQAMVDVSQVPSATLQKMSTAGLVTTCLTYPLLPDMLAANHLQQGFQAVTASFNGLQELLQRPDAGRELLRVYRQMDPNAVATQESSQRGAFSFTFTYVELLLAQPVILAKLTPVERRSLLQEGFTKFKAKDEQFETFGGFGELTSALVLGRVLEQEPASPRYTPGRPSAARQAFLATGQVQDPQVINQIVADAQALLD